MHQVLPEGRLVTSRQLASIFNAFFRSRTSTPSSTRCRGSGPATTASSRTTIRQGGSSSWPTMTTTCRSTGIRRARTLSVRRVKRGLQAGRELHDLRIDPLSVIGCACQKVDLPADPGIFRERESGPRPIGAGRAGHCRDRSHREKSRRSAVCSSGAGKRRRIWRTEATERPQARLAEGEGFEPSRDERKRIARCSIGPREPSNDRTVGEEVWRRERDSNPYNACF